VCSVLCSLGVSYLAELMNIQYCHIKETVFSNIVSFIISQKVCKIFFQFSDAYIILCPDWCNTMT
jgi:hypothetical protein